MFRWALHVCCSLIVNRILATYLKIEFKTYFHSFYIHFNIFCLVKVFIINCSRNILNGLKNYLQWINRPFRALQFCCLLILHLKLATYWKIKFNKRYYTFSILHNKCFIVKVYIFNIALNELNGLVNGL